MKNNPYVKYVTKSSVVLKKLQDSNVDELIVDDLKENEINTENTNAKYIVELVKKIVFDYYMYGSSNINIMIKENTGLLLAGLTNGDVDSVNELKQQLNDSLKKLNFNFDSVSNPEFERFLIGSASRVKKIIDQSIVENKVYSYQAQ